MCCVLYQNILYKVVLLLYSIQQHSLAIVKKKKIRFPFSMVLQKEILQGMGGECAKRLFFFILYVYAYAIYTDFYLFLLVMQENIIIEQGNSVHEGLIVIAFFYLFV